MTSQVTSWTRYYKLITNSLQTIFIHPSFIYSISFSPISSIHFKHSQSFIPFTRSHSIITFVHTFLILLHMILGRPNIMIVSTVTLVSLISRKPVTVSRNLFLMNQSRSCLFSFSRMRKYCKQHERPFDVDDVVGKAFCSTLRMSTK